MILFKVKSDKVVFDKYCNLYSKWFNKEKPVYTEMNTKKIVKLIENEYNSMTEKQRKLELIGLKERLEINRIRNVNSIEYCFYNLCMDILNQCDSVKRKQEVSVDSGFIV